MDKKMNQKSQIYTENPTFFFASVLTQHFTKRDIIYDYVKPQI